MTPRQCLAGVGLTLLLLMPATAQSGTKTVTLDPARTQVRYTFSDTLHTVHGTFGMKSGAIQFDPSTGAARGEVVIDAASGNSGNQSRDSRMRKKILLVDRYPEIDFIPQRIIGTVPAAGSGQFQIQGLCRIENREHPLTLDVNGTVTGPQFFGTAHAVIPYVAWGVKDPSTLFLRVSKDLAVDITTTGRLTPAASPK